MLLGGGNAFTKQGTLGQVEKGEEEGFPGSGNCVSQGLETHKTVAF